MVSTKKKNHGIYFDLNYKRSLEQLPHYIQMRTAGRAKNQPRPWSKVAGRGRLRVDVKFQLQKFNILSPQQSASKIKVGLW